MWSSEIRSKKLYDVMYRSSLEDKAKKKPYPPPSPSSPPPPSPSDTKKRRSPEADDDTCVIVVLPRNFRTSMGITIPKNLNLTLEILQATVQESAQDAYSKVIEEVDGPPYSGDKVGKVIRFLMIPKQDAKHIYDTLGELKMNTPSIGDSVYLVVGKHEDRTKVNILTTPRREVDQVINHYAALTDRRGNAAKAFVVVPLEDLVK